MRRWGTEMKGSNPEPHIWSATIDDSDQIATVLHASFIEYEASYTSAGFAATTPTSEQIQQRMSEGPVWVALLDNVIVGTVSAVLKREGVYIRGMALLPDARGHGIGVRLLEKVEEFAGSQGRERLFLSTTPFL